MQEAAPHRLQAGFAFELLTVQASVGVRGGPQRVLLQLGWVDPPRGADLQGRGAQRPGNLGPEDPPVVADRTAGRAVAVVGAPLVQQQVQVGDGETDLFGDFVAGGLLGAAMLVDVAGDRGDSGFGAAVPVPQAQQATELAQRYELLDRLGVSTAARGGLVDLVAVQLGDVQRQPGASASPPRSGSTRWTG